MTGGDGESKQLLVAAYVKDVLSTQTVPNVIAAVIAAFCADELFHWIRFGHNQSNSVKRHCAVHVSDILAAYQTDSK